MLVVEATLLVLITGDALELVGQSSALERVLAGFHVHVERASLGADGSECLAFVDCGIQTVEMEDTSERESTGTGSDDGNAR